MLSHLESNFKHRLILVDIRFGNEGISPGWYIQFQLGNILSPDAYRPISCKQKFQMDHNKIYQTSISKLNTSQQNSCFEGKGVSFSQDTRKRTISKLLAPIAYNNSAAPDTVAEQILSIVHNYQKFLFQLASWIPAWSNHK